jgi:signal transduction histidine kinase
MPETAGDRPDIPGLLRQPTGLDDTNRAERLAFFEIGDDDARALHAYRPLAEATVDGLVSDFYAHLLRFPPLADLLQAEPGRIARLQGLQREYFLSLSRGRFDPDHFESRFRVGDAHQRVGLQPAWYIGAFALYLRLALRTLVADTGDGARILPTIEALVKTIFLDISLAMDTYIYGGFVARETAAELERAARVAEKALATRAEVEHLKDDLTNMIVHDLKNPVNGIAMMVQLALRKAADLPEVHRGHLLQIERTCREMMRLIQNLLEISKIEEGKMPVAREAIVLAEGWTRWRASIDRSPSRPGGSCASRSARTCRRPSAIARSSSGCSSTWSSTPCATAAAPKSSSRGDRWPRR